MKLTDTVIRDLLQDQFPVWASLGFKPVHHFGTDNAIFRLGSNLAMRLPESESAALQLQKEQVWLPWLDAQLTMKIPLPLAKGKPAKDYPFEWYIYAWIDGQDAFETPPGNLNGLARALAEFIVSLQKLSVEGAPKTRRGFPLHSQNQGVQDSLSHPYIKDSFDTPRLRSIWELCLATPAWKNPPVWVHGDLLPSNILLQNDMLNAIIDFGLAGVGDPACDLIPAWSLFDTTSRRVFREGLRVDEFTWMRGVGWALSIALIIIPYYQDRNPVIVSVAKRMLTDILAEWTVT